MAHQPQNVWQRIYRFLNEYPEILLPPAVDMYRIFILEDYRRPTFTEYVLWLLLQIVWLLLQIVCYGSLALTLAPVIHLIQQLLKRLYELAVTMKHLREQYRLLQPSIRDALQRWCSGEDVAGWYLATPFDWHSYALQMNVVFCAIFCDTHMHPQLTDTVFYAVRHRQPGIHSWKFYQQSLIDGGLKLLVECPDFNDGRETYCNAFYTNGTLVVVMLRHSRLTPDFMEDPDVICYHLETGRLWRTKLPICKEIRVLTGANIIFSVGCDSQGLLSSMHWACFIADGTNEPFRCSIRTDYFSPIQYQSMDGYFQVTTASLRNAIELYMTPMYLGRIHGFFRLSNQHFGLRIRSRGKRNETCLVFDGYDVENPYKLVQAVGWKELGYKCGPQQYKHACEVLDLSYDIWAMVIRASEKEILMHIGGFNVIRKTFGQQGTSQIQVGSLPFMLSRMFNKPPPVVVEEHLVA